MTKDLTVGSPMKLIWQFSIPLVLGNLFQQMYNMVDTVIVGRYLGLDALTSVSSTTSITFLIIGFCLGTCTGLAVPVAQKFGAKSYSEMRKFVMNAAYLAIFLAVIMTIVTCALCGSILTWMKTPNQFYQGAYDYLFVIFLGIPFTFLYNVVAGIIRSLGDSKTPFYFLVTVRSDEYFSGYAVYHCIQTWYGGGWMGDHFITGNFRSTLLSLYEEKI